MVYGITSTQLQPALPVSSTTITSTTISTSETSPNFAHVSELDPSSSELNLKNLELQLWPRPQILTLGEGPCFTLPEVLVVKLLKPASQSNEDVHNLMKSWNKHREAFTDLGHELSFQYLGNEDQPDASVICGLNPQLFQGNESYSLQVSKNTVQLMTSDVQGLSHAVRMLLQLISIFKGHTGIPVLQIKDWPSLHHRALQIDISSKSAKLPNIEAFRNLIELWSKLKLNQLHLHCNLDLGLQWQFPYSPMELLDLECFCKERGVSLVPSLDVDFMFESQDGQLQRAISAIKLFLQAFTNTRYIALGESLVNQISALGDLHDLLPFDLNQVTLMLPTSSLVSVSENLQMQVIQVINSQEALTSTIQLGCCCQCIFLNPLDQMSICGFGDETISRVCTAVNKAVENHYLGVVVSPNSGSHWTTPVAVLAPTLLALGLAWNQDGCKEIKDHLGNHLDQHLLGDKGHALGALLIELGSAEANSLILWSLLENPDEADIEKCTGHVFQKVIRQLLSCQSQLHKVDLSCQSSGEMLAEVQLLTDLLIFAARIGKNLVSVGTNPNGNCGLSVINAGIANLPSTARTDLANKLLGLIEQFRAIWLCSHLPNNLQSSLLKLTKLLNHLVPQDMMT